MIILDTNVLSELMRPAPAPPVLHWIMARPATSLFVTTLTEAEILYGLRLLADGRRRSGLEAAAAALFTIDFAGRVLPFDSAAAQSYAPIAAGRKEAGRPVAQIDAQIAAIAHSRDAAVATRNVTDFEGCAIQVVNPWEAV